MSSSQHSSDLYRYSTLLICMVVLLFSSGLFQDSLAVEVIRRVVILAVLGAAFLATSHGERFPLFSLILAVGGSVMYFLLLAYPSSALFIGYTVCMGLFFWGITLKMLKRVFQTREVTTDTIAGSVCVYFLIGLSFCFVYALVEHFQPGSFHTAHNPAADLETLKQKLEHGFSAFFYFSFVTLTTLGYGDISPVFRLARNVAVMEAIIGQFYLTVLVARLVALNLVVENRK